jgi:hypothetical protein
MRRRPGGELNLDIQPVPGDEPARGSDDDRGRRIACGGRREQDAQRVALIEMRKARDTVAPGEADFGGTLGQ